VRKLRILTSGLACAAWVAYRDVRSKNSIVPASHGRLREAYVPEGAVNLNAVQRTVNRTLGVERASALELL